MYKKKVWPYGLLRSNNVSQSLLSSADVIGALTLCLLVSSDNPLQTVCIQNVQPDLDPNCLTLMVFLKEFLILNKINRPQKSMQNY